MSTLAEQVVEQLKTDMDNVYDAGYQKGLKEVGGLDVSKFGIQNEVTGTNIVTCDYVNENEHNVEVKLSSDTVTDFSGVEVKCIGKNTYDLKSENVAFVDGLYIPTINNIENGVEISFQNTRNACVVLDVNLYPNTTYAISCDAFVETDKTIDSNFRLLNVSSTTNNWYIGDIKNVKYTEGKNVIIFTTPDNTENVKVYLVGWSLINGATGKTTITNFQIEVFSNCTDYEPYTEKIYIANTDGTVDGVTSISPAMNIICDTEGVDITAKYYCVQDVEWHRFWDNFQNYGNRTNCNYMFYGSGWNNENTKPKHILKPNQFTYSFQYSKITNLTDVLSFFDTSECKSFGYMFSESDITIIPELDVKSATNLNTIFYNAKNVRKIVCVKNVNKDQTLSSTFLGCKALEDVDFTGEIGNSINFQWSPLLSDASVQSIIDCLADLTGQTAQTITFHTDVKAKLTEEHIATITSKNWTLA